MSVITTPNTNDMTYVTAKLISKAFEVEILREFRNKRSERGPGMLFVNCTNLSLDASGNMVSEQDVEMSYKGIFEINRREIQIRMARDQDLGNKAYYCLVFPNKTFYFDKRLDKASDSDNISNDR